MFSTINRKKNGFTLLEVLVAVVLSGIIIVGLMKTFDSLVNTKEMLESRAMKIELLDKLVLLVQKDIRCKIGDFRIITDGTIKRLSFLSTHSLFFNGSMPVTISYYLKRDDNGKSFFYREERDDKTGTNLIIRLTDIFNKVDYNFYLNGRWQNHVSSIVKISLYSKDKMYNITQRGMLEQ